VGERKSWLLTRKIPAGWQVLRDGENFLWSRGGNCSRISCNRVAGVKSAMRKIKQETREEKLNRQIGNLTRVWQQEPTLKCIQERRAELLVWLDQLSPAERSALVPWAETRRDAKFVIKVLGELIAEKQKELRDKQRETRKSVSELRQCQVKFERQLVCLKRMGV